MHKSVRFNDIGGPQVLSIEEVETLQPCDDEVQIRVKAIGINRAEVMFRTGTYPIQPRFPATLGYEASGIVTAVGEKVAGIKAGDAVSVIPSFTFNDYGTYAEVINVPARAVAMNPPGLTFIGSAASWMMYLTAYGAIVEIRKVGPGDTVLVGAASSSVGIAAMQITNMLGAHPIALSRSDNKREALLEAGASHVFLRDDPNLSAKVRDVTKEKGAQLVFDPVGGQGAGILMAALAYEGTFIQYGVLDPNDLVVPAIDLLVKRLRIRGYDLFEVTGNVSLLARAKDFITQGLAAGKLRPIIDRVFAFDDIRLAHQYMEEGNQVGKIVVTV